MLIALALQQHAFHLHDRAFRIALILINTALVTGRGLLLPLGSERLRRNIHLKIRLTVFRLDAPRAGAQHETGDEQWLYHVFFPLIFWFRRFAP